MRITKTGNSQPVQECKLESFVCESCGCEFEAEDDEYYIDTNYVLLCYPSRELLVCNCPECHKIIKKAGNTIYGNSTIVGTYLNVSGNGAAINCAE